MTMVYCRWTAAFHLWPILLANLIASLGSETPFCFPPKKLIVEHGVQFHRIMKVWKASKTFKMKKSSEQEKNGNQNSRPFNLKRFFYQWMANNLQVIAIVFWWRIACLLVSIVHPQHPVWKFIFRVSSLAVCGLSPERKRTPRDRQHSKY